MAKVRLVHRVGFPQNPRADDDYLVRRLVPAWALVWVVVRPDGTVEDVQDLNGDVTYFDGDIVKHGWVGEDDSHVAVSLAAAGYTLEAVA